MDGEAKGQASAYGRQTRPMSGGPGWAVHWKLRLGSQIQNFTPETDGFRVETLVTPLAIWSTLDTLLKLFML